MTTELLTRALALAVVLAGVETLHGIARTVWLVPRIGKARAQQWGVVSGSLLAWGVCVWLVPGMRLATLGAHLALGLWLALFMAAFDLALGHWLLRRPWRKALQDFNPTTGNRLVYGLALLVGMPAGVWWLRGAAPASGPW